MGKTKWAARYKGACLLCKHYWVPDEKKNAVIHEFCKGCSQIEPDPEQPELARDKDSFVHLDEK